MSSILIWLISYCLMGCLALVFLILIKNRITSTAIAHGFMGISIVLSLYFTHSQNLAFPWPQTLLPVAAYVCALAIAIIALGKIGAFYGISALVQELTMASISFILLQDFSVLQVALMVVPLFVIGHELSPPKRWQKILILFIGGSLTLLLFSFSVNVFFLAALHVLIGVWLIKTFLIYRFVNKESNLVT